MLSGESQFFSSGGGKLGVFLKFRKVSQGASHVASGKSNLRLSCKWDPWIAIESLQSNRASSCIEWGILWCFLSCGMKLSNPYDLPWGPQGTSQGTSRKSGFLSSCKGHLRIPLESQQRNRVSSHVEVGNSVLLSSWDRDLRVLIEFQWESHALSCVKAWNSAFLLSFKRALRPFVELRRGTCALSRGTTWESDLPLCCEGILSIPFPSLQGNQALSRVEGELGLLLTCGGKLGVPLKLQWGSEYTSWVATWEAGLLFS